MPAPDTNAPGASDADFERRWNEWENKNRAEDLAFRAKARIALLILGVIGVLGIAWYVFARS